MLSDEKTSHIVHLMLDAVEREKLAVFPKKDLALREAKKVIHNYVTSMNKLSDLVEKRISSQKNAPPPHSPQWETLYAKYYEEELRKRGG